jgi:hypothetical protein
MYAPPVCAATRTQTHRYGSVQAIRHLGTTLFVQQRFAPGYAMPQPLSTSEPRSSFQAMGLEHEPSARSDTPRLTNRYPGESLGRDPSTAGGMVPLSRPFKSLHCLSCLLRCHSFLSNLCTLLSLAAARSPFMLS